jgi:hypothetical protein
MNLMAWIRLRVRAFVTLAHPTMHAFETVSAPSHKPPFPGAAVISASTPKYMRFSHFQCQNFKFVCKKKLKKSGDKPRKQVKVNPASEVTKT